MSECTFLRILVSSFFCFIVALPIYAQSYDEDRIALANFAERMFNNEPFEGCRIIEDYNNSYILSVVVLEKANYKIVSAMNRVAQVKAQRNAGEFFNGTQSYSEFIVRTPRCKDPKDKEVVETVEVIKVNSTGFVQQMQLLTSFDQESSKVFVYSKPIN